MTGESGRSTKAGTVIPATRRTAGAGTAVSHDRPPLNEGRDRNPGDTNASFGKRDAAELADRSTKAGTVIPATLLRASRRTRKMWRALNEGRDRNPGNTSRSGHHNRAHRTTLNEGRDRNPGDTISELAPARGLAVHDRSTKAGTVIPATPQPGHSSTTRIRRQVRSTKAGTVIPATPRRGSARRAPPLRELDAQRRPGP